LNVGNGRLAIGRRSAAALALLTFATPPRIGPATERSAMKGTPRDVVLKSRDDVVPLNTESVRYRGTRYLWPGGREAKKRFRFIGANHFRNNGKYDHLKLRLAPHGPPLKSRVRAVRNHPRFKKPVPANLLEFKIGPRTYIALETVPDKCDVSYSTLKRWWRLGLIDKPITIPVVGHPRVHRRGFVVKEQIDARKSPKKGWHRKFVAERHFVEENKKPVPAHLLEFKRGPHTLIVRQALIDECGVRPQTAKRWAARELIDKPITIPVAGPPYVRTAFVKEQVDAENKPRAVPRQNGVPPRTPATIRQLPGEEFITMPEMESVGVKRRYAERFFEYEDEPRKAEVPRCPVTGRVIKAKRGERIVHYRASHRLARARKAPAPVLAPAARRLSQPLARWEDIRDILKIIENPPSALPAGAKLLRDALPLLMKVAPKGTSETKLRFHVIGLIRSGVIEGDKVDHFKRNLSSCRMWWMNWDDRVKVFRKDAGAAPAPTPVAHPPAKAEQVITTRPDDDWPNQTEAAERLKIVPQNVGRAIKAGKLRSNGKRGHACRVDPASILEYQREREQRDRAADERWARGT
jgi:hypothetical protein